VQIEAGLKAKGLQSRIHAPHAIGERRNRSLSKAEIRGPH
jgi:hypothetical protein